MLQKILRGISALFGAVVGYLLSSYLLTYKDFIALTSWHLTGAKFYLACAGATILFAIIFYFLFSAFARIGIKLSDAVEERLKSVRIVDVVLGIVGLIIGLLIAVLICLPIARIPIEWLSSLLTIIIYIIMAYLGVTLPVRRRDEIIDMIHAMKASGPIKTGSLRRIGRGKKNNGDKLIDTSVLIDARIYDIVKTGFIDGPLVVPVFVLHEMQLLADNNDDMKRAKGRRGLNIVEKMQKEFGDLVQVSETDYDDIVGVDDKLLHMAKATGSKIITNDYNLNKVASVRGITVLNINELAGALRPVVLPGETMTVHPVKNGKEEGQAVAYLEDGTMIVIENGVRHIGKTITVRVTSALQTAAGRMIFARE